MPLCGPPPGIRSTNLNAAARSSSPRYPQALRYDISNAVAARRNELIDSGCGSVENVRRIVAEAEREGKLDDDSEE